jgi:hypothetical protein
VKFEFSRRAIRALDRVREDCMLAWVIPPVVIPALAMLAIIAAALLR